MKKGFSLVEVLAVIVIIGLIFLIAFPTLLNSIKKSNDQIDSNTLELIKNAAKDYENDQDDLDDNYCIDISDLINDGYIEEDVVLSKDKKLINKSINKNNGNYELVGKCDTNQS